MSENVVELYNEGGALEAWGSLVERADKNYGSKLFDILHKSTDLTDHLDGLTFISVSSNSGSRESGFATAVDSYIEDNSIQLEHRPIIIASDIANPKRNATPTLSNVEFSYLQANAYELPMRADSADILFDRMGALWYKIHNFLDEATLVNGKLPEWELEEIRDHVQITINEYKRVLKPGGRILIDYPEPQAGDNRTSTGDYINEVFGDLGVLESTGLTVKLIGAGEDRLIMLEDKK